MDRNAALEIAHRLAASSGIAHVTCQDNRGKWRVTDGLFMVPTYYRVTPEGKATFHMTGRRGQPVTWNWSKA